MRQIVNYVGNMKSEGKGLLIDRFENRSKGVSRQMFMNRVVHIPKDKRIRCSIALLRDGIKPKFKPEGQFTLEPLSSIKKGTIAEETHFFIDYSLNAPLMCVQFHYQGARFSDIEYYLRQIAKELKIATATRLQMIMDVPLDDTIENLKNVLKFDIKVQPKNFSKMDTVLIGQYYSQMNQLGNELKPETLKLEASFYTPGKTVRSNELNKHANNWILDMLKTFRGRAFHIDLFDNFVVEYEDKQGLDQIFNLLKGKKEIIKEIEIDTIKRSMDWYELIKDDFDEFVREYEK
ncbi:hypothetical protein [Psychroserpens sp. S379A]|uniref:hypothetical protein n=1 Tax=Psychroserpens sp. S379A TaxID=3415137 RepID=UPI003C7AAEB5